MTSALFMTLAVLAQASHQDVWDTWSERYGQSPVYALSGNGGLTAGFDAAGRVVSLRWPAPGHADQLGYQTPAADSDGMHWALSVEGRITWLFEHDWQSVETTIASDAPVVTTTFTDDGVLGPVTITQFVSHDADVLITRLVTPANPKVQSAYWFANLTPCTRVLPEAPIADWMLDDLNGFAALHDGENTVYHLRPGNPGRADWELARELARDEANPEAWSVLGEGVWVASRPLNADATLHVDYARNASDLFAPNDEKRRLSGGQFAVGQSYSVAELESPARLGVRSYTVCAAFGSTKEEVDQKLDEAASRTFDDLLNETVDAWKRSRESVEWPSREDPALRERWTRDLTLLQLATDASTGATVRAPITQPPLALDWPRYGVWTILAFDYAGLHDRAERHCRYYAEEIRSVGRPGQPRGSMPAATYGNHVSGVPHVVLDVDAVGSALWAFEQHGAFLDEENRPAFWESVWDAVDRAASFLTRWADSRTGMPLPSFDGEALRDRESLETLLAVYLGMKSAIRIGDALDRDLPESWRTREDELDVLVRVRCLANKEWSVESTLPYLWTEIVRNDDQGVMTQIEAGIEQLEVLTPFERTRFLTQLTYLWSNNAQHRDRLHQLLETHLWQTSQTPSPQQNTDTLQAALELIIAYQAYPPAP